MITPENAVMGAFLLCILGAFITFVTASNRKLTHGIALVFVLLTAGMVLSAAVQVLTTGPKHAITYWTLVQYGFALRIYVDGLSAIFVSLIAIVAICASVYSLAYLEHYREYSLRGYYPNFLVFIGAMYGIVCTTDTLFFFFVFWQLMTLASFALVRFERNNPDYVRAANRYLLMMQLACGLTLVGAMLLATTTAEVGKETLMKYDFDTISHYLPNLFREKPFAVNAAFTLFLLGFGIKVGMWPLGRYWLPDAHPAAPSPVSALLSGVMIKTGVYGLMRYFLWLVPEKAFYDFPSEKWGLVIAWLGAITLAVGTLQALRQEQSKRMLAFSSIGQMGYILLGLGASLALLRTQAQGLAILAFYGALFHTINHALFKSLLFLNAGSLLYATGTQNLNQMGGLIRFMPWTAFAGFVGCFSIAGAPLFNGFASKWNLFSAGISGAKSVAYLPLCIIIAIFTSAITLAVFLKYFGACYLARSSALTKDALQQNGSLETSKLMWVPQLALSILCILLGIFPGVGWFLVHRAIQNSQQGLGSLFCKFDPFTENGITSLSAASNCSYAPLLLLVLFLMAGWICCFLSKAGGSQKRNAVPWLCGYATESEGNRYDARHYYRPLNALFKWVGGQAPSRISASPATPDNAQSKPLNPKGSLEGP